MPLPVQLLRKEKNDGGTCSAIIYMQVPMQDSIVEYDATWAPPNEPDSPRAFTATGGPNGTGSGPFGDEEYWSTKEISYYGIVYKVPKGFGAWLLGAGGGPAPCTNLGPGVAQAWGWTARPVVRGHVMQKGTGQPAAGVKVTANCASGGTTTTDSYGAYGFVLNPGTCAIAPSVPKSEVSDPTQRVVTVANQDITNVDFVVPGGALKVYVKNLEPLRSGLAVHGVHFSQFPADFTTSTVGQGYENHYVCESGCTDITVSVIDPATSKAPAPHATVDVSLGTFNEGSVSFNNQVIYRNLGVSVICTTATNGQDKDCGTSLHGLETNADGQVHLRYWAPGVIAPSGTSLTVTARCDAKPCQASPTTADLALTEQPYEIYQRSSTLPINDVNELSEWANGGPTFTKFIKGSVTGFNILKNALSVLEKGELTEELVEHSAKAAEKLEPIALVLDVGLVINEALEAKGMMAMFLNDSGLSPFGIGYPTTEASASGVPSLVFQNELVNQVAVPNFLKMGDGGFWWASAEYIHEVLNAHGEGQATGWTLSTTVYETSHCSDPEDGGCGPGYRGDVGASVVARAGIQPELTIELSLSHNNTTPVEALDFDIPYDALAWTTTQPGLTGVIQDH